MAQLTNGNIVVIYSRFRTFLIRLERNEVSAKEDFRKEICLDLLL